MITIVHGFIFLSVKECISFFSPIVLRCLNNEWILLWSLRIQWNDAVLYLFYGSRLFYVSEIRSSVVYIQIKN